MKRETGSNFHPPILLTCAKVATGKSKARRKAVHGAFQRFNKASMLSWDAYKIL